MLRHSLAAIFLVLQNFTSRIPAAVSLCKVIWDAYARCTDYHRALKVDIAISPIREGGTVYRLVSAKNSLTFLF